MKIIENWLVDEVIKIDSIHFTKVKTYFVVFLRISNSAICDLKYDNTFEFLRSIV